MAKLNIVGKENVINFGAYIRHVAKFSNREELAEFIRDPKEKLKKFATNQQIDDHIEISVVVDTETVTHIMVPWEGDLEGTEADVDAGQYPFPPGYFELNPQDPESSERQRAYSFRVGDYVLGRCV